MQSELDIHNGCAKVGTRVRLVHVSFLCSLRFLAVRVDVSISPEFGCMIIVCAQK